MTKETSEGKREFWIRIPRSGGMSDCITNVTSENHFGNSGINVIEKSAYQALSQKLAEAEKERDQLATRVRELVDALSEIAIEQKFHVKEKDYFQEVVRLNLTAQEALKGGGE